MKRIICIISLCLLAFGCSQKEINQKMFKKFVPPETEQLALKCLKLIKKKKLKEARDLFIPQYRTQKTIDGLDKLSELMNAGTFKSRELVAWNSISKSISNLWTDEKSHSKTTVLEYQDDLSGKWLLLTVTIVNDKFIGGINLTPLKRPLQEINAFNLSKPFGQILFLLLPILMPLFILFSLIACFMTRMKKLKWLWIIFILLGFGRIAMNWTSGQIIWKLMHIQLLLPWVEIFRQGIYGPWIICTSLPLGAILFWVFKKKLTKPDNPEPVPEENANTDETPEADSKADAKE